MHKTTYCRFTKDVLVEGEGFSKPLLESQCDISTTTDKDKVGSSCEDTFDTIDDMKKRMNVTIGTCHDLYSAGIETMLMTMLNGETSHFHVWWAPHSSEQQLEKTEENECKEHKIVIELHSFTEAVPIWQLTSEEKYELSLSHKDKGTNFFQEEKTAAAFYQYSVAMKYLISILTYPELPEAQCDKYKHLRCICYFNLAACQLQYENFDSVIDNCTKGLALDPWNVKGLYRRALAYKNKGNTDQARMDLIKIVKKQPKNKVAADLLESLMPCNVDDTNS